MPDTDHHDPPPAAEMTDTQLLDEATALATRRSLERVDLDRLKALQVNAERRGLTKALDRRVAEACVAAAKLVKRGAA